jgi:hypothetical protein
MPGWMKALLGALTLLTGAAISVLTGFHVVHWTASQTTLVFTEWAAFWGLVAALAAHFWPDTKQQPVAVAGTFIALTATTLSLGVEFFWWKLTSAENTTLVSVASAIIAVVSALIAQTQVTAHRTPRHGAKNSRDAAKNNRDTAIGDHVDSAIHELKEVGKLLG